MSHRAVLLVLALTTADVSCRGEPVYDFGVVGTQPAGEGTISRPLDVGRFISRLYADVLGRRPATHQTTIDCDAFEALVPGFRQQTCAGQSSITFGIPERETLQQALGAVADPSVLWPHLIAVFLRGASVSLPAKEEIRGQEVAFLRETFLRYLDRLPTAYEEFDLGRALREDPAMTPRALILGILSSEEYRRR